MNANRNRSSRGNEAQTETPRAFGRKKIAPGKRSERSGAPVAVIGCTPVKPRLRLEGIFWAKKSWLAWLVTLAVAPSVVAADAPPIPARVAATAKGDALTLTWEGAEKIQVAVSKSRGLFNAPLSLTVNDRAITLGGFYVHINKRTNNFIVESTQAGLSGDRIEVTQVLRHPQLASPTRINFNLWMEPQDSGLRVQIAVEGKDQHLDRLGLGDHTGAGLAAERMFFGRMYVLDRPQAFERPHDYNTCRFWCWTMRNGLTELQAVSGPAKGFRFDPAVGRYDLYNYCESPITYLLFVTARGPNEAIAQYRKTIHVPAPPTLAQLPGRVGVMTAYPITERYEEFLAEWTGRGARDFVWLSYWPTPATGKRSHPTGRFTPPMTFTWTTSPRDRARPPTGRPTRCNTATTAIRCAGYHGSSWLLPTLYVNEATQRVMGVFGHEFKDDEGKPGYVPTQATRYSNLAITRAEVGPNGSLPRRARLQGPASLFRFARPPSWRLGTYARGKGLVRLCPTISWQRAHLVRRRRRRLCRADGWRLVHGLSAAGRIGDPRCQMAILSLH